MLAACKLSPEREAIYQAESRVEVCWKEQSRKSFEPDMARMMASVCEKFEKDRDSLKGALNVR